MYYRTQLEKRRYHMKGTWSLLNRFIHNKSTNRNQPVTLHIQGNDITDEQLVCQEINTFFYSNWTCTC